jgi:hypothetical protein
LRTRSGKPVFGSNATMKSWYCTAGRPLTSVAGLTASGFASIADISPAMAVRVRSRWVVTRR